MTSLNRVKANVDVKANFPYLGIFYENKISELRNLEVLSLLNNTKFSELRNSTI